MRYGSIIFLVVLCYIRAKYLLINIEDEEKSAFSERFQFKEESEESEESEEFEESEESEEEEIEIESPEEMLEYTSNWFKLYGEVNELLEGAKKLSSGLLSLGYAVGIVAGLFTFFGPDPESEIERKRFEEIMGQFQELEIGIANIRRDIKHLTAETKYEQEITRIFGYVETLESGLHLAEWNDTEELGVHCGDLAVRCYEAVRVVIREVPYLAKMLDDVTDGSRPKLIHFIQKFTFLIGKSMIMVQGLKPSKKDMARKDAEFDVGKHLKKDLKKLKKSLNGKLDKLTEEAPKNIKQDGKNILDDHMHINNEEMVDLLMEALSKKYDWLSFAIYVFKPLSDHHWQAVGYPVSNSFYIPSKGHNAYIIFREIVPFGIEQQKIRQEFEDLVLKKATGLMHQHCLKLSEAGAYESLDFLCIHDKDGPVTHHDYHGAHGCKRCVRGKFRTKDTKYIWAMFVLDDYPRTWKIRVSEELEPYRVRLNQTRRYDKYDPLRFFLIEMFLDTKWTK